MHETTAPARDAMADRKLALRAHRGDRLAFGVLYLTHHEVAWRMACATTAFSADAEIALVEGFARVFGELPDALDEEFAFRPLLLASVRAFAVERLRQTGRLHDPAGFAGPGAVAGPPMGIQPGSLRDGFRWLPEPWPPSHLWPGTKSATPASPPSRSTRRPVAEGPCRCSVRTCVVKRVEQPGRPSRITSQCALDAPAAVTTSLTPTAASGRCRSPSHRWPPTRNTAGSTSVPTTREDDRRHCLGHPVQLVESITRSESPLTPSPPAPQRPAASLRGQSGAGGPPRSSRTCSCSPASWSPTPSSTPAPPSNSS